MRRPAPRLRKRSRAAFVAVSIAGHLGAAAALLSVRASAPVSPPAEPIVVTLVEPAPPPPPPPDPTPTPKPEPPKGPPKASTAEASPAPPKPTRPVVRRTARLTPKPPPDVEPLPATPAPVVNLAALSWGDISGARTAGAGAGQGSGGGGGGAGGAACDMVRRLQSALRNDPDIKLATARAQREASAAAILVWNGDWVKNGVQEGKGLAGVRQAIAVEVAFAPAACRAERMHGLVLLSLAEGPSAPRLALGAGQWRWTDLLAARR